MDLDLDSEEWAVLWFHRTMPVLLAPEPTRDELLIPPLKRGT